MRIIAETKEGFLLEARKKDVANLIGYSSEWSQEYKENKPKIGDDIQINKMYNQLYSLAGKQKDLQSVVMTLRGMADLLEPTVPIIREIFENALYEGE